MFYIPIIVGSTRRDRQSVKVARFVLKKAQERKGVQTELLDLLEYNFPLWRSACTCVMIPHPA
jgi:NAD(P)H-dependent FMN reductase